MIEPPPPPSPGDPGVPPAGPPPPPEPGHCPTCGAPHDPYQEYCLECGHRLPPPHGLRRTEMWSRDSPIWLWAALAALLLVALVAGAIVAVAATRGDKEATPKIPVTGPITVGTTAPQTVTIAPPPGLTTTTIPTTTIGTTTTGTTSTTPTGNVSWPPGKHGFTIVLKSVPVSEGRAQADAAAQRARNNGLTQVGVLNSSDYSSLRPGYWVTFTGIYDTSAQAENNLANARSKGFPLAYAREVRQ